MSNKTVSSRELKANVISSLVEKIKSNPKSEINAFVFDYSQVTSNEINQLRGDLSEKGADLQVVKNTLIAKIFDKFGVKLSEPLKGQNVVLFPSEDFIAPVKALSEFIKASSKGAFKIGLLNGQLLNDKQINELAKLPEKEVLIAKLLGSMNSPISGFVHVLNGVQGNFVRVIAAVRDSKGNN